MKITIKHTNVDSTPAINEYIEQKISALGRYLKKFESDSEVIARVEVARTTKHHHKGQVFRAEVNLQLPKKMLRAEHQDFDVRVAIDVVKDKLHREIIKYKETLA